ncbi:hypothetical protein M8818_003135 [Zalaria obscura]|uniref:Uncharacterized protein n=1 Tax=Zalaria obscura TaxID=2024903 RepID=A0ACC3SFR6_9PEZI
MVHLPTPAPSTGHFNTSEVRPRTKYTSSTTRTVAFPPDHYRHAPNIAAGFTLLDLSSEADCVRAKVIVDEVSGVRFRVGVDSGSGGGDGGKGKTRGRVDEREAVIWEAGVTWMESKRGARECAMGRFDTAEISTTQSSSPSASVSANSASTRAKKPPPQQEYSKRITFPRPFKQPADVTVWLSRLDLSATNERNFRIHCYASHISTSGFTAHIDTWSDSVMDGAAMDWIAVPRGKKWVASGGFATGDVRSWSDPRSRNRGSVKFPGKLFASASSVASGQGEANGLVKGEKVDGGDVDGSVNERERERKPRVFCALNMLDMAGNADLRVKVYADEIGGEGFRWHLDSWGDSTLYAAGASWIALGFPP